MHPVLLHLGRTILPTFGLLAALGLMAALSLTLRSAPLAGLLPDALWNATLFLIAAAFLVSRLLLIAANLHSFLHYPVLVLTRPSLTATGLLLSALASLAYLKLRRIPLLPALDAWAAPATLLWAFLALGHLAEGSDPGLPSRAPWAVRVPLDPDLQIPVALFVSLAALGITALNLRQLRRPHAPGHIAALALALTGLAQFLLSFLRQPFPYDPNLPALPLDPIQILALGMLLLAGILALITTPLSRPSPNARQMEPR